MSNEDKSSVCGGKVTLNPDEAREQLIDIIDKVKDSEALELVSNLLTYVLSVVYEEQAHSDLLLDFIEGSRFDLQEFFKEHNRQEEITRKANEEHAALVAAAMNENKLTGNA